MARDTRRSGLSLVLVGLVGGAFFWATDPRWGLTTPKAAETVDAIARASPGTVVGIAGCAVVALLGLWLTAR